MNRERLTLMHELDLIALLPPSAFRIVHVLRQPESLLYWPFKIRLVGLSHGLLFHDALEVARLV